MKRESADYADFTDYQQSGSHLRFSPTTCLSALFLLSLIDL